MVWVVKGKELVFKMVEEIPLFFWDSYEKGRQRKLQPPRLRRQQVIRESQVVRGELRGNHSGEDNLNGC